jgi:hypothetical protein
VLGHPFGRYVTSPSPSWDLLRFTWHDLTNRPDYVVAEIQGALATAELNR